MKVVHYEKHKRLLEAAQLCLTHRLFVPGWSLNWMFHEIINQGGFCSWNPKMAICFVDDKPVAVAITWCGDEIHAFCRKDSRRNGYASACVKKICKGEKWSYEGYETRPGTDAFWYKNKVRVF